MKQTHFFRQLVREAWLITWKNKVWWFFGFIAVFLSGSLGYQLITRNVYSLAQPNEWVDRWSWLNQFNPGVLLRGQWRILTTDPTGWFALVFGWLVVLIVYALLFAVSVLAIDLILSALKLRRQTQLDLVSAAVESRHHFRPLLACIISVQVFSYVILLALSIPVTVATMSMAGASQTIVYIASFLALFLISVFISLFSGFTLLGIVAHDRHFMGALREAWRFLCEHWIISLLMLVLQIAIIVVATLLLLVGISLILIPIIIAGYLLVAYGFSDITAYLPQLVFYGMVVVFSVFAAAYMVFQLACWHLLFTNPSPSDNELV